MKLSPKAVKAIGFFCLLTPPATLVLLFLFPIEKEASNFTLVAVFWVCYIIFYKVFKDRRFKE